MAAGLSVAIALLAELPSVAAANPAPKAAGAPSYGPPQPAPAPAKPPEAKQVAKTAGDTCASALAKADTREIVICAQRPQGYRLNPDVMEARREMRSGGRPTPSEKFRNTDCATIGPMGCRGAPTINLLAAAATLARMGDRLSKGQEIGSMFVTDPHPSEYQLYLEAKKRREAKEAEAAAKAKGAQMKAAQAERGSAQPVKQ